MSLDSNQLQIPDYIVLVGYFALIMGVGVYFYRHMKGMKDYFSGGNTIPWWLSGVSFYMSSFSVAAAMIDLSGEGLFRGMIKSFSVFTAPVAMPMILGLLSRKMKPPIRLSRYILITKRS